MNNLTSIVSGAWLFVRFIWALMVLLMCVCVVGIVSYVLVTLILLAPYVAMGVLFIVLCALAGPRFDFTRLFPYD